jgi:hypothetical protein
MEDFYDIELPKPVITTPQKSTQESLNGEKVNTTVIGIPETDPNKHLKDALATSKATS